MIKCRLIIVDNYYFCSYFNGIEFQLKNFIATTSTLLINPNIILCYSFPLNACEYLVFHQLQ